jgi:hypothetical protein
MTLKKSYTTLLNKYMKMDGDLCVGPNSMITLSEVVKQLNEAYCAWTDSKEFKPEQVTNRGQILKLIARLMLSPLIVAVGLSIWSDACIEGYKMGISFRENVLVNTKVFFLVTIDLIIKGK